MLDGRPDVFTGENVIKSDEVLIQLIGWGNGLFYGLLSERGAPSPIRVGVLVFLVLGLADAEAVVTVAVVAVAAVGSVVAVVAFVAVVAVVACVAFVVVGEIPSWFLCALS